MAVIQATIWAERWYCQPEVLRALKFLCPPAGVEMHRLWLATEAQQAALEPMTAGLNVQWRRLEHEPVPQYRPSKERKAASVAGFRQVLASLRDFTAGAGLLLYEDDVEFPADALMRLTRLIDAGADVATGLVRTSSGTWPIFCRKRGLKYPHQLRELPNKPLPVLACGTYCLLLSPRVVAALLAEDYQPDAGLIPDWRLHGKDMHLCRWLHDHGFCLVLDPALRGNHHVEQEPGQVVVYKELTQ